MEKRKICVVTGTRAEYGLLYWTMKKIQEDSELELQIIVTGMHLSSEFGMTFEQIEKDGFVINEKVEMLLSSDTPIGITKSVGLGIIGLADSFNRLNPDIVLLLGDRFEILAAAQAAMFGGIPIAHIHGGEITLGAIDDQIRHAITKMSSLHFVAADEYRSRVIQLGEIPERVINVGALGLEYIDRTELFERNEVEELLRFQLDRPTLLVTHHPTTNPNDEHENNIEILLSALEKLENIKIIFTKSNSDEMGITFNRKIHELVLKHSDRMSLFDSLGQKLYLSTVSQVDMVIGNSSSGIIEVPYLKKPALNIGSRQAGRLRSSLVIDCKMNEKEIIEKINYILSNRFQKKIREENTTVYSVGNSSGRMVSVIKQLDLSVLKRKVFFDIIASNSSKSGE